MRASHNDAPMKKSARQPAKAAPRAAGSADAARPGAFEAVLAYAVLLLVWAVVLYMDRAVTQSFVTSKALLLKCGVALLGAAWAARLLARGWPQLTSARVYALPLLAWLAGTAVATAFSADPGVSLVGVFFRGFGLEGLAGCALLYFVLTSSLRGLRPALHLCGGLVALGAVSGGYACWQHLGVDPLGWMTDADPRTPSFFGNSNVAGNFLALLLPLAAAGLWTARGGVRGLAAVATLLIAAGLVFTQTRGAWAGAALGLLAFFALAPWALAPRAIAPARSSDADTREADPAANSAGAAPPSAELARFQRWLRVTSLLLLAGTTGLLTLLGLALLEGPPAWVLSASGAAILVALAQRLYARDGRSPRRRLLRCSGAALTGLAAAAIMALVLAPRVPLIGRLYSAFQPKENIRGFVWRDTLGLIAQSPLVGTGPEVFGPAFRARMSLQAQKLEPETGYDHPHNQWLGLAATTGLCGLLPYLWLLWRFFRRTLGALRDTAGPPRERLLLAALFATGVSHVVWSAFAFDSITTILPWFVLLALCASLVARADGRRAEASAQHPADPTPGADPLPIAASRPRSPAAALRPAAARRALPAVLALFLLPVLGLSAHGAVQRYRADHATSVGLALLAERRPREALAAIERARALAPEESYHDLAAASLLLRMAAVTRVDADRQRWRSDAEAALRRGLRHTWQPEKLWLLLSELHEAQGRTQDALASAREALRWAPHRPSIHANLGARLLKAGEHAAAEQSFQAALAVSPETLNAQLGLGWLLLQRGELARARQHLEHAKRLRPDDTNVRQFMGELEKREGQRR